MSTPPAPTLRSVKATELRQVTEVGTDDAYVLAVDLGTGGPKVAVIAASGGIAAHSFQRVGIEIGEDGSAEQNPDEWWAAVVACTRKAMADSGVSPDRIVGVGCTAQWSG